MFSWIDRKRAEQPICAPSRLALYLRLLQGRRVIVIPSGGAAVHLHCVRRRCAPESRREASGPHRDPSKDHLGTLVHASAGVQTRCQATLQQP